MHNIRSLPVSTLYCNLQFNYILSVISACYYAKWSINTSSKEMYIFLLENLKTYPQSGSNLRDVSVALMGML